ncbi:MAG: ABC transporter permease [Lachnospiraceae bacterium]|nr:ABC transporter permease [Lachnospiraceae bacterium]
MITFFVFTLLAAFLIFHSASAIFGMGKVLETRFEEVNGPHVIFYVPDDPVSTEVMKNAMTGDSRIVEYETAPVYRLYVQYRNSTETEFEEYLLFLANYKQETKLMNLGIDTANLADDDVLLPYYLKGRFKVGDTFVIKLRNSEFRLNVAGYVEDPYYSSSINITVYYIYTSQTMIDRMLAEQPDSIESLTAHYGAADPKVLEEGLETTDLEQSIQESYKSGLEAYMLEHPDTPTADRTSRTTINWHMMRGGAQFLPMVVMGSVLLFAVLILVIAIIIIAYGTRNFIIRNMKNTGILEAAGYTVSMLRRALALQIVTAAFAGSLIGVALGIATRKPFGNLISMVLGLTWNQSINWIAAAATVLGLSLVVFLTARVVGRIYNRITVLDALRGGITSHNFSKNHCPLDRTGLPLPVAMSVKSTLGGFRRSLVLALIAMVLSITTIIGFGLYENFGAKKDKMIGMMGFESGTAMVAAADMEAIGDELTKLEGASGVLIQTGFEPVVSHGDKNRASYTFVVDDVNHRENLILLEGRVPVHDNEIMLTQVLADDLGVKVGDVVKLTSGNLSAEYLVTGLDQRMERMGRTANLTYEAAAKVFPDIKTADYYIFAKDGVTFEDLEDEINRVADSKGVSVTIVNSAKNIDSTFRTISASMKALCVIFVIITLFVVIFTESLVVRAKIAREWKDMGVSKALGMTSGQLVVQIMLSNLPAVLTGSIVGSLLAPYAGREMCKIVFSLFGLRKVEFTTAPLWVFLTIIGIVAAAAITSATVGMCVRRLKPVEMITEE